jgi:NitT/TauT family transport system permease protein
MTSGLHGLALRLLSVLAVLAVWELLVRGLSIPAYILPPPTAIFAALYQGIVTTLYIDHIWITLTETLLGFAFGTALAFALGTVVALSRTTEFFLYPFIVMFQAMPKVALAPLIIVWFGLGLTSKVVNAALVAFFPLMVNTIVGLRSADEDRVNLMRSLAATPLQIFWMLQLPNALPYIFAGLEIAMIFALIGAIVAEFVGAQAGLGMLIQSMNFSMDVAGQFSVLLILSILGLCLNSIIVGIRRRVLFWDEREKAEARQTATTGGSL